MSGDWESQPPGNIGMQPRCALLARRMWRTSPGSGLYQQKGPFLGRSRLQTCILLVISLIALGDLSHYGPHLPVPCHLCCQAPSTLFNRSISVAVQCLLTCGERCTVALDLLLGPGNGGLVGLASKSIGPCSEEPCVRHAMLVAAASAAWLLLGFRERWASPPATKCVFRDRFLHRLLSGEVYLDRGPSTAAWACTCKLSSTGRQSGDLPESPAWAGSLAMAVS